MIIRIIKKIIISIVLLFTALLLLGMAAVFFAGGSIIQANACSYIPFKTQSCLIEGVRLNLFTGILEVKNLQIREKETSWGIEGFRLNLNIAQLVEQTIEIEHLFVDKLKLSNVSESAVMQSSSTDSSETEPTENTSQGSAWKFRVIESNLKNIHIEDQYEKEQISLQLPSIITSATDQGHEILVKPASLKAPFDLASTLDAKLNFNSQWTPTQIELLLQGADHKLEISSESKDKYQISLHAQKQTPVAFEVDSELQVQKNGSTWIIKNNSRAKDIRYQDTSVDELNIAHKLEYGETGLSGSLSQFNAQTNYGNIQLSSPVKIEENKILQGTLTINPSVPLPEGGQVKAPASTLTLRGAIDNPQISLSVPELKVTHPAFSIPAISLSAQGSKQQVKVQISSDGLNSELDLNLSNMRMEGYIKADEFGTLIKNSDLNSEWVLDGEIRMSRSPLTRPAVNGKLMAQIGRPLDFLPESYRSLEITGTTSNTGSKITARNIADNFEAELFLGNDKSSKFNLDVDIPELQELYPPLGCGSLNISAKAEDLLRASELEGSFTINRIELGCASPLKIQEYTGKIKGSTVFLPKPLEILYKSQPLLSVQGSSNDLKATLDADVQAFNQFQLPVSFNSGKLRGTVKFPELQADISIEELDLIGRGIPYRLENCNSQIKANNQKVEVLRLEGSLMGGKLNAEGAYTIPSDASPPVESTLKLSLKDAVLDNLVNGLSVVASSKMKLQSSTNEIPAINGVVTIRGGQYAQEFSLTQLIQAQVSQLTKEKEIVEEVKQAPAEPSIKYSIQVKTQSPVSIKTSWASVLVEPNLEIDSQKPALVSGKILLSEGTFGIRGKNFENLNGHIILPETGTEPMISLDAERTTTTNGLPDITTISVRGPASDPEINLKSSQGRSEQELYEDFVTGGDAGAEVGNQIASDFEMDLAEEDSFLSNLFGGQLLDSLKITPYINPSTGHLEPRVAAEKDILSWLSLRSSTTATRDANQSQVGLTAEMTRSWGLSLSARKASVNEQTSTALEFSYSPFEEIPPLQIKMSEESDITADEFVQLAKIRRSKKLRKKTLPLLERRVSNSLIQDGYRNSSVKIECLLGKKRCSRIKVALIKGEIANFAELALSENFTEVKEAFEEQLTGKKVTTKVMLEAQKQILEELHRRGYQLASFSIAPDGGAENTVARINGFLGPKFSYSLSRDTDSQFQDIYKSLLEEGYPPSILRKKLEDKIRALGYLECVVNINAMEDHSYEFEIISGKQYNFSDIALEGDPEISSFMRASKVPEKVRQFQDKPASIENEQKIITETTAVFKKNNYRNITARLLKDKVENNKVKATLEIAASAPFKLKIAPECQISEDALARLDTAAIVSRVQEMLHEKGFLTAQVEATQKDGVIQVSCDTGKAAKIGKIEIEGNTRVDDETVLLTAELSSGQPYSQEILSSARLRLIQTTNYRTVQIDSTPSSAEPEQMDILIDLSEKRPADGMLGFGYDSVYGIGSNGSIQKRFLFEDYSSLVSNWSLYFDPQTQNISKGEVGLTYTKPHSVFGFRLSELLAFQLNEQVAQDFDLAQFSLSSILSTLTEKNTSISFGHNLSQEFISGAPEGARLSADDDGTLFLSGLSFAASGTKSTDFGPRFQWSTEASLYSDFLFSKSSFASLTGSLNSWIPTPSRRFHFEFLTRLGRMLPLADTSRVPITRRFYIGGRNSVRGFRENRVGPLSPEGANIGGEALFAQRSEVHFRATESLDVLSFWDMGTVWLPGLLDFDLRHSWGLGTRFKSPVGEIGVDLGFPLEERPGEPSVRLHISVGGSF